MFADLRIMRPATVAPIGASVSRHHAACASATGADLTPTAERWTIGNGKAAAKAHTRTLGRCST
ncbi:MAG: hypothetical protein ACK5OX_04585 [Desertimonas sp.]